MSVAITYASDWKLRPTVKLAACPNCGGRRYDLGGSHAPHFVERDGRAVLVDCVGQEVARG